MISIKKIPESLKMIIDKKDMTLSQLAKILGISISCLHHWVHGRNKISYKTLLKIIEKIEKDPQLQIYSLIFLNSPSPPIPPAHSDLDPPCVPTVTPTTKG